jgi:phosphocarrier protein HPr
MQKLSIIIQAEEGLHARPAHLFCSKANEYLSDVKVRNLTSDSDYVNAKSILMILTLGVMRGNLIEILCEGNDEIQAMQDLKELIEGDFSDQVD